MKAVDLESYPIVGAAYTLMWQVGVGGKEQAERARGNRVRQLRFIESPGDFVLSQEV